MRACLVACILLIAAAAVSAIPLRAEAWPAPEEDAHLIRQSPAFDEEYVLAELTEHLASEAAAEEEGEGEGEDQTQEKAELSEHTKQWIAHQLLSELSEWADQIGAPVTYEEAVRFREKHGARSNPISKGLRRVGRVVRRAGRAVGGEIKKGANFLKEQAKKLYEKYKCPLCKFAIKKAIAYIQDKGVETACKYISNAICSAAVVPICEAAAPICRTAVCPLVNPLLAKGCSKILDLIVEKIKSKLNINEESVCKAIKLCK